MRYLDELDSIADSISTPQAELGYRKRTQIERLLFLLTELLCRDYLKYQLGGLSTQHARQFSRDAEKADWPVKYVQLVNKAFDISRIITQISSTDPYVRADIETEFDTDLQGVIKVIVEKLRELSDAMRKQISAG